MEGRYTTINALFKYMCWSWPNDKKANPQQRINNVNDRQWLLPNWSFLTRWGTRWWHTTYIIVDTECISEYVYLRTHTNIAWIYTSDRPSGGGMTIWRKNSQQLKTAVRHQVHQPITSRTQQPTQTTDRRNYKVLQ